MRSGRTRVFVSSIRRDVDLDIVAEDAALFAVERQAVEHRQRIRRNRGAEPLDDVAVVVVVRRLDENQGESPHNGPHRRVIHHCNCAASPANGLSWPRAVTRSTPRISPSTTIRASSKLFTVGQTWRGIRYK